MYGVKTVAGSITNALVIVVDNELKTVYFSGQLRRLYQRLGLPEYEELVVNYVH